ncbi:transporter [Ganoderma sinense ZZ0214-1]|uniref:Transporter n=1 Tax=Ganoderma sinense ZZ0214-1 TaxID=1077348 RepID=A0A2G8SKE0_9APHY|nr:transporter [Ganoderma sinense ZZ0214-1]
MTPLNITSASGQTQGSASTALLFDRLAPLSAPRFASVRETPQTKAETELHLRKQAETMTMLSIRDLDRSDDESGYDSDPDAIHNHSGTIEKQRLLFMGSTGGSAAAPFSSIKARTRTKGNGKGKSPGLEVLTRKGLVNDDEVVEAISPGGHVTKRRARSRPVSAELLESVHRTPVASQDKVTATPRINESKSASTVAFPSTRTMRTRTISNSSTTSSESASPRRRPHAAGATRTRTQSHTSRTLNRLQSSSSATLFFGPSIGPSTANTTKDRKSGRTSSANNKPASPLFLRTDPHPTQRPQFPNRHSYAGSGSPSAWASRSPPAVASSPVPVNARKRMESDCSDDEADLFFSSGPADSSFAISLQRGCTPSPKKKQKRESLDPLPKKFRPRDSGVVLSDSDDDLDLAFDDHTNFIMAAMPRASTSVSTVASSFDDHELVTPGIAPSAASGWPTVVNLDDDHLSASHSTSMGMGRGVDAFILRTLAAGGSVSTRGEAEPKRVPGTPVKKVKTAHLVGGVTRPWQSAVAHKIGFKDFDDVPGQGPGKGKSKPRKSLPAAFPGLGRPKETKTTKKERQIPSRAAASASERDIDVDLDDGDSPTMRRDAKYDGLGLGRPTTGLPPFTRPSGEGKPGKAHWLMRRSSSGAFSTASDGSSINATPTRLTPKEWMLPAPRIRTPGASPLKNALEAASRSTSGSSTSTSTVTNSPTVNAAVLPSGTSSHRARKVSQNLRTPAPALFAALNGQRPHTHAHPARQVHAQPAVRAGRLPAPTDEEAPGRFLRDYVEVDELGSGEFGRAMKVHYKDPAQGNDVFAVKKSKRFEGVKHRLRLREEVDILKHLSDAAARSPDTTVRLARRHPNILGYIDSWEEDETLYIQTELCELGNFAHFLWEYGRAFPRLDEARVWKIMAELAAGLRFIHDVNVIHLDLKPANIFLTGEGRLKIGDFGMASVWPRPSPPGEPQLIPGQKPVGFEREGDKLYLAPEVLQGRYGKAADVFSLGMTMLEAASNIVVPDQGEAWHRLRREDFSQVELDVSPELWDLIKSMMRAAPALRIGIQLVDTHPVVARARHAMERMRAQHGAVFGASPLGAVPAGFLDEILVRGRRTWDDDDDWEMDLAS